VKVRSIVTTPNPNHMRFDLTEAPKATQGTYDDAGAEDCPAFVRDLLCIPGVRSLYLCGEWFSLQRSPKAEWSAILTAVVDRLGKTGDLAIPAVGASAETVKVEVQVYRRIPIQVKAMGDSGQARVALPERFQDALRKASEARPGDYLKERRWEERVVLQGTPDKAAATVAEEIDALIDDEMLGLLVEQATATSSRSEAASLEHEDWKERLKAVQALGSEPVGKALRPLAEALQDPKPQVRGMAAAALGAVGDRAATKLLCRSLKDESVAVRRTAGDSLSDLADPAAVPHMIERLKDPSRIVRWRAARYLAEMADPRARDALRAARTDSAYEVCMEVEAALRAIEGQDDAAAPVWAKISEHKEKPES